MFLEFEKHSAITLNLSITSEKDITTSDVTFSDCSHKSVDIEQSKYQESNLESNIKNNSSDSKRDRMLNKNNYNQGVGADPSKPPCKKAKLLRLERKSQKLLKKGEDISTTFNRPSDQQKSLNQFLEEIPTTSKHKLKVSLILVYMLYLNG